MHIMKKKCGIPLRSLVFVCLLTSPFGSMPGNVSWCSSPASGSLFKATSDLQSVAVSF